MGEFGQALYIDEIKSLYRFILFLRHMCLLL